MDKRDPPDKFIEDTERKIVEALQHKKRQKQWQYKSLMKDIKNSAKVLLKGKGND